MSRIYSKALYVVSALVLVLIVRQVHYMSHPPVRARYLHPGITSVVSTMKQQNKPILVTVINDAYMPFLHSWLCNTMHMGIHDQVLAITADNKSSAEIETVWPKLHTVSLSDESFHGDQDYSSAGYVRIMIRRTELILQILEQDVEILLFDLDTFWKTDPLSSVKRQIANYDIAAVPVSDRPDVVCGGFIYMKPTASMIKLWTELTQRMLRLEQRITSLDATKTISEADNDQAYVSHLLKEGYADIKVKLLSLEDYPDGTWYNKNDTAREESSPLVVHNNWIVGNKAKIDRAKHFKQWFWDPDNRKCLKDLVILQTLTNLDEKFT